MTDWTSPMKDDPDQMRRNDEARKATDLKWRPLPLPMVNGFYLVCPISYGGDGADSWDTPIGFAEIFGCEIGQGPRVELGGIIYKLDDHHDITHWCGPIPEPPK